MFGSHLESSAHMVHNQLARIITGGLVQRLVFPVVKQQVVPDAAAYKALLDIGNPAHLSVNIQKGPVVAVQIGAYLWMNTRRTLACSTSLFVLSVHHIHIGTGTTQVAEITFEIRLLGYLSDFAQYTFLGTAHYEFALMGADGAERTASEAATMQIHAKLYHVVGRNPFPIVLGVG